MEKVKKVLYSIMNVINKFDKDHISEYSAEAAFFMVLSFIPFIMLMCTLVKYVNADQTVISTFLYKIIPSNLHDYINGVLNEIYSKNLGTITISAIISVWSAGKCFYSLTKGFKTIYMDEDQETINKIGARVESLIVTVLTIIVGALLLLAVVFGNQIKAFLFVHVPTVGLFIHKLLQIRFVVMIFILFLLFLYIYKVISNRKMKLKYHVPGAIVAALGWYFVSYFISIYVNVFKGFTMLYGSLSTIILLLIWLFFSIYMILIGCELNWYLDHRRKMEIAIDKNK